MTLLAVTTTVSDLEDARSLAKLAINAKLAACVQLEQIESFYPWQGTVQNEPEIRVLFKTTPDRYEALRDALLEHHPYDLPAIHAVQALDASQAYVEWVRTCLTPSA
jgi:periplasmic divalent cation tolerance protein